MFSKKNFGVSDSVLAAARQSMTYGSVPLTKVEAELAETQKSHTVPKTSKEKSLAALAKPKDKITHKDVMVGRGVVAKEQIEGIDDQLFTAAELESIKKAARTNDTHAAVATTEGMTKKAAFK